MTRRSAIEVTALRLTCPSCKLTIDSAIDVTAAGVYWRGKRYLLFVHDRCRNICETEVRPVELRPEMLAKVPD